MVTSVSTVVEQLPMWEELEITCSIPGPRNWHGEERDLVMITLEGMKACCKHCKREHLIAHQKYLDIRENCIHFFKEVSLKCKYVGKLFAKITREGFIVWCKSCHIPHFIDHLKYMKVWQRKKKAKEDKVKGCQLPLFVEA